MAIAEILSVGTELLLGDIVNTNAQFLSRELASLGISVYHQTVVGDNKERLLEAYKLAFERSDIVITTGGLGPTEDDITKEIGAEFFNKKLLLDKTTENKIDEFFKKTGMKATKNNLKQAYFPEGSTILNNSNGTAPGCLIEENNKMLFMIPGPPNEMVPMFKNEVKKILELKSNKTFVSKTLKVCGVGESLIEEMLLPIMKSQTNPSIALYAKTNEVEIRITASSDNEENSLKLIEPIKNEIISILGNNIYSENGNNLVETVCELLKKKDFKISVAESCTGGMISSYFVSVPGVSELFLEGCVTYSNEAKIKRLSVKSETLEKFGAVSEETAIEMATGIAKELGAEIGISTTGVAGPDGGTKEKPVGLVYVGLYINGKTYSKKLNLTGNRQKIRERATISALDFLRRHLL